MQSQEKQRLAEEKVANLIADSFFEDMHDWIYQKDINCYAFARGLTFPDLHHNYYSPGKIYHMKSGKGDYIKNQTDPHVIDAYVKADSIALNQKCERVTFSSIKEDDGNFYLAITNFHMIEFPDIEHWHFICRTPSGMWLHKPNWSQKVQTINWNEYGRSFNFVTIAHGNLASMPEPLALVPCEGICFEDYFYKLEIPED